MIKPPKKLSEKQLRNVLNKFCVDFMGLKTRLIEAGFYKTFHALGRLEGEMGWEAVDMIERINKKGVKK